jgi:CHASE3 domain sensor protein
MRRKGMLAAAVAFAVSPQGRRLIQQARNYVRSPQGQRKLSELRGQVGRRRAAAR